MTQESIRLVLGEQYRDAVTDILEPKYDVVPRSPPAAGDLCLVEREQFLKLRETLKSLVEDERPRFYPIVLFRQRNPTGSVDVLETDGRSLIDDVVTMPIDKEVLHRRLENLLIRRRYSVSLSRYHRKRHEQFKGLFDSIAEPAVVVDDDGEVIQMNDLFCGLLGETRESLFGCSIDTILSPGDGTKLVETGATPPTSVDDQTVRIDNTDGETHHVKVSTRLVMYHGEEYTVLILTDITALRRRLDELQRRLETVEQPARTDWE